jgi:acetyl-CoA acetyltransferase
VTLSAGGASGLVALGHAADLLWSGHADALVAGGADALGDALRAWIADGGVACRSSPSEGAALLVLEPAAGARRRGVPVLGTIAGFAGGFEPGHTGEGLAGAIGRALAEAEVQPSEVTLVVAPEDVATLDRERRPPRIAPGERLGETFGASGPLGVLAALAEAPRGAAVLVADACSTGHVAALVVRAGEPA